ncbi:alpha/beta fold hydrolase [Pseudomonas aeruginosa]|uniref:alpha/beta hydrolase n=1 Tax=Pseudomonas aeruginosa TaxID=287 RepID=UPI000F892C96|nr:alpha/beta fold hydrolase [Pseudomonas aeruginosa]RUI00776.1 alpha/beta fold hydrolase [Pseudomonas aeruginosa]
MSNVADLTVTTTLQFLSNGTRCICDFYRPQGSGPFPVVLMGHGLGGTRRMRIPAFAQRFTAAGYACLAFDYRHFGDSEGEPRQLLDIGRQLEDWHAAIAYARTLPFIDAERIVLWGTSFGGGHVLSVAAEDPKIAAVISQCPFTDGLASSLATPPWSSLKLTGLALLDLVGSLFGAKPVLAPLAGRPGDTAFMTSPDTWDGYHALITPGAENRNEIAARFALQIIRYYPGRRTHLIQAPVLFCICDPDSVAPSKKTLQHALRAPRGEIKRYPYGHFAIYVGKAFEEVVSNQINFLMRAVPVNTQTRP